MLKNTENHYGLISIAIHWLAALTVFGLFGLGYWMVDLSYYSEWYKTAPYWHKSVGILLALLICFRLLWRILSPSPKPLATHASWERKLSAVVQFILYGGMFSLFISGYLISTADNRAISVFGWFDLPSAGELFAHQADIAGWVHQYIAYLLIAVAVLHGIAALKHHFFDKDNTLTRMLRHNTK